MARDKKAAESVKAAPKRRSRQQKSFPSSTFAEAISFAKNVHEIGSGQSVRRLTLFDEIGKSPTSSSSRSAVTNASKYGLTKGHYNAEFVELTPLGLKALSETNSSREKERAKIDSAILSIPPFKGVYESFIDSKLPAKSVLSDKMIEFGVSRDHVEEAVDTLIVNLRDVGLLKTLSGAERIISVDMRLDELPSSAGRTIQESSIESQSAISSSKVGTNIITADRADFETTAFYVSPIGSEGSETRKHADLF